MLDYLLRKRWTAPEALFQHIRDRVPKGGTILELGSGYGSRELARDYTVYSIEHSEKWAHKFPEVNYILAPLVDYNDQYFRDATAWYDPTVLERELPKEYDAILIDGPPGKVGRAGFYTNLHLFRIDVPMFFDDVHRLWEFRLMGKVAGKLDRTPAVYNCKRRRWYGVIDVEEVRSAHNGD